MQYFHQGEDQLLFGLIERDNPSLFPKLTTQNCYITTAQPNTGADAGDYNTIATVRPRFGSGLFGPSQIKYNRIDLADLFKGMDPVEVSGFSADFGFATRAEMPKIIAACYGLPINAPDVDPASAASFYVEPHAQYGQGVFRIAGNKCFIGEIKVAFKRDVLENIANLIDPPVLNGLTVAPWTKRGLEDPRLPAAWSYFGDFDFTEIISHVDHTGSLSAANIAAIAAFTGIPFNSAATGPFDPAVPYQFANNFGITPGYSGIAANNKISNLIGRYPWLNNKFTHCKILTGTYDPVTNAVIPVADRPVFALYYNKYEA